MLRIAAFLVLFAEAAAGAAHADPRIDQIFSAYGKDTPGCALAVVRNGGIVYSKGYGMANLEHGVPITPRTVFDIGSLSKQITAASILLLAQDSKLSLDDDVRNFVPEANFGMPMTLRHLLHHTSGLRDYIALIELGGVNFEDVTTKEDALAVIARQKALDFRPGEEFSYSNSNYFLLSLVVERASGKTLRDFAQERIFTPLGMTSTRFLENHTQVIPGRAASYIPKPGGGFNVLQSGWQVIGDGGVQSTVEDLAKWDRNFYEPKVGGTALVEQLQEVGVLDGGAKTGYAGGLYVGEHRGLRRVAHGGNWGGYAAQMIRFPGERLSVIALCNQENANPTRMGMQVAEIYLGDRLQPESPAIAQEKPSAEPFSPTDLSPYVGTYFSEELDATYTLAVEEGRLVSRTGRQNHPAPLEPVSVDAFRKPDGTLLRFSRSGKEVDGFAIDAGRARNLGFTRTPPVSRLGEYKGYSELVYDGWERTSFYIPTRDGTRLAMDLFRPTRAGKHAIERLPVIWTANRYQRAMVYQGKLYTILDNYPWMADLVRHGYVVAVVDVRGSGASFGTFGGQFNQQETRDSYDVTEWLGTQPWSSGKVGMYGASYLAMTQYMVAGQVPPHLTAIIPEKGGADMYALLWNGGILRAGFVERWTGLVRELDVDRPAPPVDGPEGEALLRAAVAEHRANRSMAEITRPLPFRDSVDAKTGVRPWIEWSAITYRKEIERSGVAIYHLAGWFDRYVLGQILLYKNLDNPQRLLIAPWSHVQGHGLDLGAEHRRFYDYWLKGIDNGIMKEDPVHYYVMGSGWRSARQWPLPEEKRTSYWFAADGGLTPETPPEKGRDTLAVDYSASVWPAPRWSLEEVYPADLSANDAKGITYTTPPLTADVEVTGHPVVRLWLSADVADADLFVYLEEVDAKGASHYVTEGSLRASLRATSDPGFDYLGMPWHRSFAADAAPLPKGEPVELAFDLFPTSNLFDAGHRIRVTVTGADKANGVTPEQTPPPRLVLHREKGQASHIVLPIIPPR